jgi:hypothetical protein
MVRLTDAKDLEMCERIAVLMRDEVQIRRVYNEFRVNNNMWPVDFTELAREGKIVQL